MRTLLEMLTDYPMALLRGIAETLGVPLSVARPMQAAEQLAAALSMAESVERATTSLSAGAKEQLARLSGAGGRMTVASFTRTAGTVRAFGAGRLEQATPWRQPAGFAEELWYRALIGRTFADTPGGAIEFFYIPTDILPLLTGFQESARPTFHLTPVGKPAHPRSDTGNLLEDVCTLLITVHLHAPRMSGETWREGDTAALRQQLWEPKLLPLLLHLADQMGWLSASRGRLSLVSDRAHDWLGSPRHEQALTLFTAWRDDEGWNDLSHVPGLRCTKSGWRNDPLRTRQSILRHLARSFEGQEGGTWFRIGDFIGAIERLDPDFQRPDGDYDSWYIQDAETGEYLRGFETWQRVEGALIAYILAGPLRALGVVQLGMESPDAPLPTSFCITRLGRWLLGLDEDSPPSQSSPLAVDGDFTITLHAGYTLLDRFRVARFAVPLEDKPGLPWRYQIRQTSLAKAQQEGLTPERILTFLQQASNDAVPEKVTRALMQLAWPRELRARKVWLLETSAQLSAQLRKDPRFSGNLIETATEAMLLIEEANWPQAVEVLKALGLHVSEASEQPGERKRRDR